MPGNRIIWTNTSVLKFAGGDDPINRIEATVRDLVLRARDAGWVGPPYNPIAIADFLKIPVEANSEIADARTIATHGRLTIEFNPTKPRERVRFSIAHEIAHTLFPDVSDKIRHRAGPTISADEWQLEMLCNLAAAELVMPLGSLPARDRLPKIEQLMLERRRFDVSAEAFLMRVVKTTAEPALMFCASSIEKEGENPRYRVEYSVRSKSSPAVVVAGTVVPTDSIVYSCTAIGQTNHGKESWIVDGESMIECVGIPGYPGSAFPRVACVVRFATAQPELDALNFVQGDVLRPVANGPKVICQLVNDKARIWGGERWLRLSEQPSPLDKWIPAGVQSSV